LGNQVARIAWNPENGRAALNWHHGMEMKGTLKLCVGASSGGHMAELKALLEFQDRWRVEPGMYVTTMEISVGSLPGGTTTYVIGECDRHQPLNALRTLIKSLFIARRERPDVVITTGSMPLALFSLTCKFFGAKIIWIDSISQIDRISLSGRLMKPFSDLFFVQWPELAQRHTNVLYAGELI
jgi:UDP-N-acetylglucosamine:LPS N-acetylglucosamine transferase